MPADTDNSGRLATVLAVVVGACGEALDPGGKIGSLSLELSAERACSEALRSPG